MEVGHLRKRGLFSQRPGDGKVCLDPGKSCGLETGDQAPVQTSTCSGGNWGSEKKVMCPNSHSQLNPNEVPG